MCTAIAKKGKDILYGFNLDIDPETWNFALYKNAKVFTVGIKVGSTLYYTHGVNRDGHFGNVPYMNGEPFTPPRGIPRERIDLMTDRYLRGKYSFADVETVIRTRTPTSIPAASMHSLIGDRDGNLLIVEPGYGHRAVTENYAVLTNFPVLTELPDYSNPFYGKDRYDRAVQVLSESGDDFSVDDALQLLAELCQTGPWGTRISFVYSVNENKVTYFLNGDATKIQTHCF